MLYIAGLTLFEVDWGTLTDRALFYLILSSFLQIVANGLLVTIFGYGKFLTAIVLYRTETFFAALIGFLFIGDPISIVTICAIVVGIIGIALMKRVELGTTLLRALLTDRMYLLGLVGAATIAGCAVSTRAGILSFDGGSSIANSAIALLVIVVTQTLFLTLYLWWRNPTQLRIMFSHWRSDTIVGASSALGSMCWLWALAVASAALVKGVGQVEILFSALISHFFFNEKYSGKELIGAGLVAASIVILALGK